MSVLVVALVTATPLAAVARTQVAVCQLVSDVAAHVNTAVSNCVSVVLRVNGREGEGDMPHLARGRVLKGLCEFWLRFPIRAARGCAPQ